MFISKRSLMIAILVIASTAAPVAAQDNFVGIKGGLSIPRLSGGGENEVSRDYQSRLAPNFGVQFEFGMTDKVSIQPEVNFAGNGGKREGIQPITSPLHGLPPLPNGAYYYGNFKNVAILNYLEIPVLLKYRWKPAANTRGYVNGGMFYGRLLSAKTKTSGSSTIYLNRNGTPLLLPPANQPLPPIPFDATTDIENDVNHHNFGVAGGGGLEFKRGKGYFFIDGRVNWGLRHIQKDIVRNGNSHTGNLIFSFGYAFKIGED